jgi:hypothetical protein
VSPWGRRLAIALIAFQVLLPVGLMVHFSHPFANSSRSDAARYQAIAIAPGRVYVDHPAEYPPLAIAFFKAIGPRPFRDFFLRLIALQALAQAVIACSVFWAWGKRAGWRYLALSAPLLPIVLTRFDLVSVAAAVAGAALLARRKQVAGGALIAVGMFVKVWPVALLPGLIARRQWRAAVVGWGLSIIGFVAWLAYGGTKGVRQVLTYRGAHGWHIESVAGSLLYAFRRKTPFLQEGAVRVGAPSSVISALLVTGLVLTVLWVWWRVSLRGSAIVPGIAEATVVAGLLAWATLFSPQFVAWLLPWVAIAGAFGEVAIERATWVVVGLTVLSAALATGHHRQSVLLESVFLARNLALIAVLVTGLRAVAHPTNLNRRHKVVREPTL